MPMQELEVAGTLPADGAGVEQMTRVRSLVCTPSVARRLTQMRASYPSITGGPHSAGQTMRRLPSQVGLSTNQASASPPGAKLTRWGAPVSKQPW